MVWCIWLTGCDGISINGDFESVIYFLVTAYSHKGTQWNLGCSFPFGFDKSNELFQPLLFQMRLQHLNSTPQNSLYFCVCVCADVSHIYFDTVSTTVV